MKKYVQIKSERSLRRYKAKGAKFEYADIGEDYDGRWNEDESPYDTLRVYSDRLQLRAVYEVSPIIDKYHAVLSEDEYNQHVAQGARFEVNTVSNMAASLQENYPQRYVGEYSKDTYRDARGDGSGWVMPMYCTVVDLVRTKGMAVRAVYDSVSA